MMFAVLVVAIPIYGLIGYYYWYQRRLLEYRWKALTESAFEIRRFR